MKWMVATVALALGVTAGSSCGADDARPVSPAQLLPFSQGPPAEVSVKPWSVPPVSLRPWPGTAPARPIVIAGDNGGEIGAYITRYHALAASGATFRINGRCASACTIVLAYADRVCVTKRAILGFHEARDRNGRRLQIGSDYIMSTYPVPVREFISAHGGLPSPKGMLWVTGSALRGLVKPCE